MSTLQVGTIKSASSAAPVFQNSSGTEKGQLAKAWVNFNGSSSGSTKTIRGSFNVSSVTDNNTGDYTINFINSFSNSNYCPVQMTLANDTAGTQSTTVVRGSSSSPTTMTASALRINVGSTSSNSFTDKSHVFIAIFGD